MGEYSEIIRESYRLGAIEVLRLVRPKEDEMSQRQAYSEFGKDFVDKAVSDGTVSVVRSGSGPNSKKIYSRAELTKARAERRVLGCIIRIETGNSGESMSNHKAEAEKAPRP